MTPIQAARQSFQRGAFLEAIDALEQVSPEQRSTEESLLLGVCLARSKRVAEAVSTFALLLESDPNCYEALTWMAGLKKNRREIQEAVGYAQRAVELNPTQPEGHSVLGGCYLYLRKPLPAIDSLEKAVSLAPDVAEHEHNLGLAYLMDHRHGEAIPHLKRAIELAPKNAQSYLTLAGEYLKYGIVDKAIDCLSGGLAVLPLSAPLHSMTATAFSMIRNDAAAERHLRRAIELSSEAKSSYAAWLLNQGRFSDADAIYEEMLQQKPTQPLAFYGVMQYRKLSDRDAPFVQRMQSLVEDPSIGVGGEMRLRYALGKAHEQRKNFAEAIASYDAANFMAYSIHNAGHPFDPAQLKAENDRVLQAYESIANLAQPGNPSPTPIFIVGMIRSGTTLLDQILSSHPSASAAGELRFWIEESLRLASRNEPPTAEDLASLADRYLAYIKLLAGDSDRITDKMPLNFAYVGLIHAALPNARFLHIRRHPVDTCLSIYTTYFGQGASFAYRRDNIVAYYLEYQRMMEHWRAAIPKGRLLELDYEELIANPTEVILDLLDFCGLPWDEACLHHDQNPTSVNTPSRWQARQPIYTSSIDRWRRYEPWLREFEQLLVQ